MDRSKVGTYVTTRDVMNSKSDKRFRHPVAFDDTNKLSYYYAVESRLFCSKVVFDEEKQLTKLERTRLWFVNEMVFDFDFDAEHVASKTDEELESMLKFSLNSIESLMGKPKRVIKNRTSFSQWEIDRYFTMNGVVKLPKKWGAQVVYELSESVQSQFVEQTRLYNQARLAITKMVGADLNFRGHMYKNHLSGLFDVEEFKEHRQLSLREIASIAGISNELVEKVMSLPEWHTLKSRLSPMMLRYNRRLTNWYLDLNSFKRKSAKGVDKIESYAKRLDMSRIKTESRNVTLFNYLSALGNKDILDLEYESVVKSDLFDHCDIQEPIPEEEFEYTRENILEWRNDGGFEPESLQLDDIDQRVLKIDLKPLDLSFAEVERLKLDESLEKSLVNKKAKILLYGRKRNEAEALHEILVDQYEGKNVEEALANVFLQMGGFFALENVRNMITPEFVHWVCEKFEAFVNGHNGLDDIYHACESALYLTHFRLVYAIRDWRASKSTLESNERATHAKAAHLPNIRKEWNIPNAALCDQSAVVKHAVKMKVAYAKLKRGGHLKEDGSPLAISYYQSLFHVRNADASLYVKAIRMYVAIQKALERKREFSFDFLVSSDTMVYLIKILNIIKSGSNRLIYDNLINILLINIIKHIHDKNGNNKLSLALNTS